MGSSSCPSYSFVLRFRGGGDGFRDLGLGLGGGVRESG